MPRWGLAAVAVILVGVVVICLSPAPVIGTQDGRWGKRGRGLLRRGDSGTNERIAWRVGRCGEPTAAGVRCQFGTEDVVQLTCFIAAAAAWSLGRLP